MCRRLRHIRPAARRQATTGATNRAEGTAMADTTKRRKDAEHPALARGLYHVGEARKALAEMHPGVNFSFVADFKPDEDDPEAWQAFVQATRDNADALKFFAANRKRQNKAA